VKIELRCSRCGKGVLVDESQAPVEGGYLPCVFCGSTIVIKPRPVAARPARAAAPVAEAPAPTTAPPAPAATAAPADSVPAAPSTEVCCPRCGLHFTPERRRDEVRAARPVVLLVEDMDYFVEIARDALAARYEVRHAKTVAEARALLARGGVDLLLLDVVLEDGQDGLRLLQEAPGKTCPVLLFTAQDESEMYGERWDRLRALGVDDVVMKGMNMGETLTRKVGALLGEPQAQDTYRR
jgi:CheY-like chemotaxis protein/DNA-directed RNA polymerase subunit RPC12/RpoP